MKTPVPIAALASVALLGLTVACDRRDPPSAPAARSSAHFSGSASGAGEKEHVCTNAGLEGAYGFYRTGTTGAGPFAAVGLATYDGAGNWTATQTMSRGGVFIRDATSAGHYEVSADCSGKLFSDGQEVARFALADRGRQVFTLSTTLGETVWGVEKNVPQQGCTNGSLDGTYGFYRTGMTSAGPLAAVGLVTFDGAGNVTGGSQTISRGGVFNRDVIIAPHPYEVSADCTGRLITAATGQEFARVVAVDKGNEIFSISLTAGNAVIGVFRKLQRGHDEQD